MSPETVNYSKNYKNWKISSKKVIAAVSTLAVFQSVKINKLMYLFICKKYLLMSYIYTGMNNSAKAG